MQSFAALESIPAFLGAHRWERTCAARVAGGLASANAALPQRTGFSARTFSCAAFRGIAKQFNPQSNLLRKWSRDIKNSKTDTLDTDEHWYEFKDILLPVPNTIKQSTSQMSEQVP
jgi:hypothetical protein